MTTNIALCVATLTLCLTFPSTGNSIIKSATAQQSNAINSSSTADQATEPIPDKDGIYRTGGKVMPPKLIHSVEPKISKKDRKLMRWGKTLTLIQLTVNTEGQAQNVHVIKSSLETMKSKDTEAAAIIDQSCLDAVNQYHFEAASFNGKAVPVLINVQVQFKIY